MSNYSEYCKIVELLEEDKYNEIQPIINKHRAIRDLKLYNHFRNNFDWNIGDMLRFNCVGSGYYGIYLGIENDKITMDITSKGGKYRGEKFKIDSCEFACFKKINK